MFLTNQRNTPAMEERPTAQAATQLGEALAEADETVGVVETCTGGLIGASLTSQPGASAYFKEGFVPYSYDSIRNRIGVTREVIDANGVISEPVTRQLAQRARDLADTTWGLATTGIAGPTGGSPAKPVGTTFVGLAYAGPWESESSYTQVHSYEFEGNRAAIRDQLTATALQDLLTEVKNDTQ